MKRKYLSTLMIAVLTTFSVSSFTSCKDYSDDISNLQEQIDKASLAADVQTLREQVKTALANDSATAVIAKNAVDAAAANAGNITNLDNVLKTLEGTISTNSKATAKRIDSLANAGTVTDTEILNLQKANKAAADSAASALAKNKELSDELTKAVKEWTEAKADYYTAEEIDNYLYIISYFFEDIDSRINDTNTNIDDLKKRITNYKVVVDALYTAVTEVTLVTGKGTVFSNDLTFGYGKITQDLTFGEKEKDGTDDNANAYSATPTKTYKKDAQLIFPKEILVRVNPVNANITPSMIKLVNSKGETLDSLLEVAKVEKYDGNLYKESEGTKTRASIATGLWKVTLQPKADIDVEKQIAQTTKVGDDDKSILFAVAINNTASQAEQTQNAADRYVVSDYELTVGKAEEAFKAVTDPNQTASSGTKTGITIKGVDLSECKAMSIGEVTADDYIKVKNGEEIEISFDSVTVKDKIDRFYVVLDKKLGAGKEWSAYKYEGLNKVISVNNGTGKGYIKVTIPETASVKDVSVPFRIFAVNYNGEYYNQIGNTFTLYVTGEERQASVTGDMSFADYEKMESSWTPITGSLTDASDESASPLISKNTVVVTDSAGHQITLNVAYAKDDKGTEAQNDSEVKYVKFSISGSTISNWVDGGEAKGTISNSISSLQVSLTKKLPTKENILSLCPYTWKEGQLVDGVYTAYMYPYSNTINSSTDLSPTWKSFAYQAYVKMNEAFSNLSDKYTIVVHDMEKNSTTGEYTEPMYVGKRDDTFNWLLYTNNLAFVDNKTKHKSEIIYDCGKISSKGDEAYKVTVGDFQLVLACPLDESVQTYNWIKLKTSTGEEDVNYITYGDKSVKNNPTVLSPDGVYAYQHVVSDVSKPADDEIWSVLNYIKATNSSGRSGFDLTLNSLLAGDNAKYVVKKQSALISNDRQKEYYFYTFYNSSSSEKGVFVYFQRIRYSMDSNPDKDVPSTLVLSFDDAFRHTHTIKMPFTVKPATY